MYERIAIRAVALGLSGLITLSILSALAATADQQHAQACTDYARIGTVQQLVIIGQRQPRT
jgi:hypothetical protein